MRISPAAPHDEAALERAVSAVDPAVVFAAPRVLRRILRVQHGVRFLGALRQRHSTVLPTALLQTLVTPAEIGRTSFAALPAQTIVLVKPHALGTEPAPGQILLHYRRLLFRARVQIALADQGDAALQPRVLRLGPTEWAEMVQVLERERYLPAQAPLALAYPSCAAFYLELGHFAPEQRDDFFPALSGRTDVEALFAEQLDVPALLRQTEIPGAAAAEQQPHAPPALPSVPSTAPAEAEAQATAASARGNDVRAAVWQTRAGQDATPALARLTQRLAEALTLSDAVRRSWQHALQPLLLPAAAGFWTQSARLLYDVQKVCTDHERPLASVNAVSWLLALGKQPLEEPLPHQQAMRKLKHLRSAARRVCLAPLAEAEHTELQHCLHDAIHGYEEQLRTRFRPRVQAALTTVGLAPVNIPERVAHNKVCEELLDSLLERGFLTLSVLRDVLSRNQLKLADLAGPGEWLRGDALLQLDRELAQQLRGVYRRGEIYLRGLQRGSSLLFGTRPGRLLTLFLLLPLLGAFVLLAGTQFLLEEVGLHLHATNVWSVSGLAVFLLLLLHWPAFRQHVWRGTQLCWRGLRTVVYDLPSQLAHSPLVQAIWRSRALRWAYQHLLVPLLAAALTILVALLSEASAVTATVVAGSVFLVLLLATILPVGQLLLEIAFDFLTYIGQNLSVMFVVHVVQFFLDAFRWLVGEIERLLYTIDEWLRFRQGDSSLSRALKAVLSPLWAGVAYVVRFAVILLIEPQVNPIKHFPVVTVAHKLLLTQIPMAASMVQQLFQYPEGEAIAIATAIIFCIPGLFGFLVWELKENWRLYRANRSATLRPVLIGHHGESMRQLLTPGFHSGTIPKLFARLRRAERRGQREQIEQRHEQLHHVELSVRHFVERELLQLLRLVRPELPLAFAGVQLATNRVLIALGHAQEPSKPWVLCIDQRAGWLLLREWRRGWVEALSSEQQAQVHCAMRGLGDLAGVDVAETALHQLLPSACAQLDVDAEGLRLWFDEEGTTEVVYAWRDDAVLTPVVRHSMASVLMPSLPTAAVLWSRTPTSWDDWVRYWAQVGIPPSAAR